VRRTQTRSAGDACSGRGTLLEGDFRVARDLLREALNLYTAAGCERYATRVGSNLAEVEFQVGDVEAALQLAREAAENLRADAGFPVQAAALCNASAYLVALRRFEEARSDAREALALAQDARSSLYVAWALQHLAAIAALRVSESTEQRLHDLRRAARLLGFVDARFSELGLARHYTEQQEYDKMLPVLRNELGAALHGHMGDGTRWSEDQAVAEALEISRA
jgi:tetratricopeptide (TPR) repeat protein